jgi:hypothetical protein
MTVDDTTVFITLGSGNEFGISDSSMFIRQSNQEYYENQVRLDLGAPTKNEFDALIRLMKRLRCHMEDG